LEPLKILAITQARSGSTRLPDKIFKEINRFTLLDIHVMRILKSKRISQLLIATTLNVEDNRVEDKARKLGLPCFRGSVNDVLDRYYQASKSYLPDLIVRLTSDCPLIDANLIDMVIDRLIEINVDYCSNSLVSTFPDGMDVEVFKFSALERAWNNAKLTSEREHVTSYIYNNSTFFNKQLFTAVNFVSEFNYGNVRLTVDEERDFLVVKHLIEKFGIDKDWKTYADYYLSNAEISKLNSSIGRNEGYIKSLNND